MGHNRNRRVAIVGGGIGGLTAAVAFARQGAQVTVFEQAAAITEVGAGIQTTPNAVRALYGLGLRDAVDRAGMMARAVQPVDALSGRTITQFDLTGQSPAYRFFHRAAMVELLAKAARDHGAQIELNARIAHLSTAGTIETDAGPTAFDLIVGADGLHSVTRPLCGNTEAKPFFTGQVAWRAIVPAVNPAPVAQIWMAPGRHVVTYPLSHDTLNVVAVQERKDWAAEGWHHRDDPANLRDAFADCSAALRDLLSKVDDPGLWGLFRHPVAAQWHREKLAILGDAAHPTLPFLAQGANMAIEDAFVMARCCDETADMEQGLVRYQTLRHLRVSRAIATANANAANYHLSGTKRRVAHLGLKTLGAVAPNAFLNRLSWLYDHDVTA